MKDLFPQCGRLRRGYHPGQVDSFFEEARSRYERGELTEEEVRSAAFDLVIDGYQTGAVDSALDRLEAAVVRRARAEFVSQQSEDKWMTEAVERATTLYPRLQRPSGERFRDAKGQGYAKPAVDTLCDQLVTYFETGAGVTAQEVRIATFPLARGAKAYDEGVVDAFLDRAVEVLLAVE